MTVLDLSEKLYAWYAQNDTFIVEEDFKQVVPISESIKKDKACLIAALKELEKHEMVTRQEYKEGEYWILKRSFASFEQSVTIHPPLAHAIAEEINLFCDLIKDDTDRCDPSILRDTDIGNLLMLYKTLRAQQAGEDDIESWIDTQGDDKKK
jgi:hypothetical protein